MRLFYFILLFLPLSSIGQDITILISDIETREWLPFANIYFKKSGIGTSTNIDGLAKISQKDVMNNDTLIVSYIGYETYKQPYSKENYTYPLHIKLKDSSQTLSTVILKYVKPLKPEKIIKKAIKDISKNYSTDAVIYNSLYRESIEENGTYIQLNEAFIKTHYTGYPQKKLDRTIWENWFDDESYAFDLDGNRYFRPLLNDFNTKDDKQIVLASRHSNNLSQFNIETALLGDPLLLFAFDKIKYQYDFFNPAILNKYQFKHQAPERINGELCYAISFYPKSVNRHFGINLSKKNKSPIYIGKLYISKTTFALLKFQYKLAVEKDFGFFQRRIPLDYFVEMNYKKRGPFYSIDNIKYSETKKIGTKRNGESILHKANKTIYVLSHDTKNVTPFADSLIFKSTYFSSIRHYKKNYNPEYWQNIELPDSIQLGKKIIKDLEINQSIFEQFEEQKKEQKKNLPIPHPHTEPFTFKYHNQDLDDGFHWMALPKNENQLKAYLEEENSYANNALIEDKKYQKKLFNNLNSFYGKDNDSENVIKPNTYFIDDDSLDNHVLYYQEDSIKRIEVFNLSLFENNHKAISIKQLIPNEARNLILVQYEKTGIIGDFATVLPFGKPTEIDSISNLYKVQWYSDSTLLYAKTNAIGSSRELCYRDLKHKSDSVIFTENDPKFDVEIKKINNHLICNIQSKTENEIYLINQTYPFPTLELIKKRKKEVIVDVKFQDGIYVLVNDENEGSTIEFQTFSNPNHSELIIESNKGEYIANILPFNNNIFAIVYEKSIPKLKYVELDTGIWHNVETNLGIGDYDLISSSDSDQNIIFSFSSPSHPFSKYKYNVETYGLEKYEERAPLDPKYYLYTSVKRLWAKSHDGIKIPITIVRNRTVPNRGLILKTYGAYGAITTPYFNAEDAILLKQGFTIAYAHVRGESILGPNWYKSGRQLQKVNSILDYIHCAEHLIKKKHTTSELLIGYGNSAGGLIVSQAMNLRPELFNSVILDHAYLDVINTMMNDTLPLTIDEYKEWGNPQNKEVYDYISKYSPYQNIKPQKYPNVLLIASYQDYQTPIWQIAKFTAKLKENNKGNSEIIMLTDMSSGHIGNTTGKEWIKLFAKTSSFIKVKNN